MDGFVTLATSDAYLQRAVMLALSAKRFDYPTTLLYKSFDPSRYAKHFFEVIDIGSEHLDNDRGGAAGAVGELKRYCYKHTLGFSRCAFSDADSLVIRDPAEVFELPNPVHTPGAKVISDDMRWAVPPPIKSTAKLAQELGISFPLQTLNGGFLVWKRGAPAEKWFEDFGSYFGRLIKMYRQHGAFCAREELCMALAFANNNIELPKSDSSIGIWDAHNLVLDIEQQVFRCVKAYYWEGHEFEPCIAHFGGSSISDVYRQCVECLCDRYPVDFPLFKKPSKPPQLVDAIRQTGFSISPAECKFLKKFVEKHGNKTVLEFGPGMSTASFADAGCEVYSLEYDEKWYVHFKKQFADVSNVHVLRFDNREQLCIPELDERRFDLGFVDSPIGALFKTFSRLNACEYVAQRTKTWILHDAQRTGEQQTLSHFQGQGWRVETNKNMGIVTRIDSGCPEARTQSNKRYGPRDYSFSHWTALPTVSCQCITYGRPELLDEAVESFLRQDYPGERELIILNDCRDVILEDPGISGVHVFNIDARFRTVGEKRNACCGLCTGDIIFPWDDDDISFPWRISYSIEHMINHQYYKLDRLWYWANGQVSERKTVAHAMGAWSKELFDRVGGYPHIQSGQDQAIEDLFAKTGHRHVATIDPQDIFYLYRFPGTGSFHLSAHGFGKGYDAAEEFVKKNIKAGVYKINPNWAIDYPTSVRN